LICVVPGTGKTIAALIADKEAKMISLNPE